VTIATGEHKRSNSRAATLWFQTAQALVERVRSNAKKRKLRDSDFEDGSGFVTPVKRWQPASEQDLPLPPHVPIQKSVPAITATCSSNIIKLGLQN
jgi:hypothetical protein